jgi:hypothetical protein
MKKTILRFAIALLAAASAFAGDLTISFMSKIKGPMGLNSEGVTTHYYSSAFHKTVAEDTKIDTLVDYTKGVFYTIKHKDKKIEMMSFDDLAAIGEGLGKQMEAIGGMPGFLKGMMGGGDAGEVKVEKLGPDTVAGRACTKYKLTLGKMVQEISADPSLVPPMNPAAFQKFQKLRAFLVPGPSAANMKKMYDEVAKIKGMALRTRMTGFMGSDSTLEATQIVEGPIAATVFALPAGYKTEDVGKKMREEFAKKG